MAKYVTVGLLLIAIFSYDIMLLSHYYIYYNMFSPGVPRPRALLILCHYVILYFKHVNASDSLFSSTLLAGCYF